MSQSLFSQSTLDYLNNPTPTTQEEIVLRKKVFEIRKRLGLLYNYDSSITSQPNTSQNQSNKPFSKYFNTESEYIKTLLDVETKLADGIIPPEELIVQLEYTKNHIETK